MEKVLVKGQEATGLFLVIYGISLYPRNPGSIIRDSLGQCNFLALKSPGVKFKWRYQRVLCEYEADIPNGEEYPFY